MPCRFVTQGFSVSSETEWAPVFAENAISERG